MKFYIVVAYALLVLALVGCQPNEKVIEKIVEKPNNEKLIKLDESMSDDELADAGEQLLNYNTFPLAEKAFNMALIKNPENLKAQFYKEGFLKMYTSQRGILTRIKPLMEKHGRAEELEKFIREFPNTYARKYLLDAQGLKNIENISDVQDFFFEVQTNWNDFRKWLIINYDKSLTLNLDPYWLAVNAGIEGKNTCDVIDVDTGKAICNYDNVFRKKLTSADLMGLRQMVAGMVLFYTFYNSYNMDGFEHLQKADPENTFTPEQKYKFIIERAPQTYTLREKNMMKQVLGIGSDLLEATKYAIKYKNQLCPKGEGANRQRIGFLFQDGICVANFDSEGTPIEKNIEKMEHSLKGTTHDTLKNNLGIKKDVRVDYLAWFRNPPKDLKEFAPASYDECGMATSFKDSTLGGIFIDRNAEEFVLEPRVCILKSNKGI